MDTLKWKKIENEAGYPCYIDETSGKQSYDHPQFSKIMDSLEEYNEIKYSAYRIAFKIFALQRHLQVPPLRISSGVFARHQLSLSESSLSLDTAELEAVLADIYFAAEKEGLFSGDVDLTVDLLINLLLNVYDKPKNSTNLHNDRVAEYALIRPLSDGGPYPVVSDCRSLQRLFRDRNTPIRVLAAKTLLILLSEEPIADKWVALANCSADHNGCVSPKRLAALLVHVMALPKYLGCQCDYLQSDVDSCFENNAGMLGVSVRSVGAWGTSRCASARWLSALCRVTASRVCSSNDLCSACATPLAQMLKFKCSKCNIIFLCENCYLYDKDLSNVPRHKKTHLVQEIIEGEIKRPECLSFIKGMKKFFFCTKKKKKSSKKCRKNAEKLSKAGPVKRKEKPVIFTSTVGKASGNKNNPAVTLQDVITQLENENKAIKDLTDQLEAAVKNDNNDLKAKVDEHYKQISTQINKLKMLKDNLLNTQNLPSESTIDKTERPQAFDLFSPIPIVEEKPKVTENIKNQPRVLSMDSGNFSVTSKPDSQNLLTMSGDALKPVVVHATSDSITTVSMNDVSNWYNDTESTNRPAVGNISSTEQRYAADLQSVERGNQKVRDLNADLDAVLDRLQQILTHNFAMDDSCFDNTQLRETANEMEGLLGSLIRGVEERATLTAKGLV